jgi:succinyl-CoA synthetase beta subunit
LNIHEYQARRLLSSFGLPYPVGRIAKTPDEAGSIAAQIGKPVVIKAQVLTGGRGKAGGVKLAEDAGQAKDLARHILDLNIKGYPVKRVLVVEAIDIAHEFYLGITIDRVSRKPVMMASVAGGVDIEEVNRQTPEQILSLPIDPLLGLQEFQSRQIGFSLGLTPAQVRQFTNVASSLYRAFASLDASLCEINPLIIDRSGNLRALDAKLSIDDNALFRQTEIAALRDLESEDPLEQQAREQELSYVKLDGEVGCIVNGAGLAMATMDLVKLYGAEPANFLDIGGGARAERVATALRLVITDPNVKVVLINIFGGITRCDEVAKGVVTALEQVEVGVPIVVRLVGTNEDEGRRTLQRAGLTAATSVTEAAKAVIGKLKTAVESR